MPGTPSFLLNGREIPLADADATESLLRWLNRHGRHGTKEGCADGDCGACTVAVRVAGEDGRARYDAINSCLLPIGAVSGREIVTVEALADGSALHPVQQAMYDCAGSQCGYCTPGFVMSLFAAYYTGELDDGATEGNLCRCTGYRPIREATALLAAAPPREDRFVAALAEPLDSGPAAPVGRFHNPDTIGDALALKSAHPEATWIAGATDLGVSLGRGREVATAFIALDRVAELAQIDVTDDAVRIGACSTLSRVGTRLAGMFPALDQMLPWFAGRQVRNRSTFGGNLGTASPIGDLLPVLLALDAAVELRSARGGRTVAAQDFFLDYR
ncbi:MAG TPA: FAD binding domain-containing protein, partial [Xanthomonadales bacterium]|nr:FAD binding domain-containing protein [Xanthomonadales bacterium]